MSRLEIVTKGPSGDGAVVRLDGTEIQNALRGLSLDMEVGEITTARLDVLVVDTTDFDGDVSAHIPEAARELLIKLGWTPPPEDS